MHPLKRGFGIREATIPSFLYPPSLANCQLFLFLRSLETYPSSPSIAVNGFFPFCIFSHGLITRLDGQLIFIFIVHLI
jgi:hypothetical protein